MSSHAWPFNTTIEALLARDDDLAFQPRFHTSRVNIVQDQPVLPFILHVQCDCSTGVIEVK